MISNGYTAAKVVRKLEIKQVDGQWALFFDDPTTPITDPQIKEEMTMQISNLYYPCKNKPNNCGLKE
jgi:hypothetical protein